MGRRADNMTATVVDFPPPASEGQQDWEQRLLAQLLPYLPEDQVEAGEVVAIMREAIERRSTGQRQWERARQAAYLLSMFPDDYRMARRIVSQFSCHLDEDGA